MLYSYYDKKVILLIDEFDMIYETSYVNNCYDDCMDFMNSFLGKTLKTNEYLEFSVITGILRISKESIFSELNNLSVFSVKEKEYIKNNTKIYKRGWLNTTNKEVENNIIVKNKEKCKKI